MTTTVVNFATDEGQQSYSEKSYVNYEYFKMLYGDSPSEWADKLSVRTGRNWDRMQFISQKFGLAPDYVAGVNLSDECINHEPGSPLHQHLGCTSVAVGPVIGQTLDLFTVELCIVREKDALYLTFPPYLCLLGMGKYLAMCTNHLFDEVDFDGVPISHIRRNLLDLASLEEAIAYLKSIKPTTSVNFILSDGTRAIDVEVSRTDVTVIQPHTGKLAHTNHVLTGPFNEDSECLRLQTASRGLLDNKSVEDVLGHDSIVQPISDQFGTIITVWMDPKKKTLSYKDPDQTQFQSLNL